MVSDQVTITPLLPVQIMSPAVQQAIRANDTATLDNLKATAAGNAQGVLQNIAINGMGAFALCTDPATQQQFYISSNADGTTSAWVYATPIANTTDPAAETPTTWSCHTQIGIYDTNSGFGSVMGYIMDGLTGFFTVGAVLAACRGILRYYVQANVDMNDADGIDDDNLSDSTQDTSLEESVSEDVAEEVVVDALAPAAVAFPVGTVVIAIIMGTSFFNEEYFS